MLAYFRKLQEEREEGFTLIELLVVIIIIGILAAIAIPIFLAQRNKGYDAGIKSDLRNAATAEESYLTDYNAYNDGGGTLTPGTAALTEEGLTFSSTSDYQGGTQSITAYANGDQCYVLSAVSASGNTWTYVSNAGGLQTKDFPVPATC